MRHAKTTWLLAGVIFICILFVYGLFIRNKTSLAENLDQLKKLNKLSGQFKDLQTGLANSSEAFTTYLLQKDLSSRISLVQAHRKVNEAVLAIKRNDLKSTTKEKFIETEHLLAQEINYEKSALLESAQMDSTLHTAAKSNSNSVLNTSLSTILKEQSNTLQNLTNEAGSLKSANNILIGILALLIIIFGFLLIKGFSKRKVYEPGIVSSEQDLTNEEAELIVSSVSYKEVDAFLSKENEASVTENFEQILAFSREALIIINAELQIIVINNTAQQVLQKVSGFRINNNDNINALNGTAFESLINEIVQIIEGKKTNVENIIYNNIDDEYYKYNCSPTYDSSVVTTVVCSIINVTTETKANNKIQQLIAENKSLAKLLNEQQILKDTSASTTVLNEDFLNTIEHDLRTPVNDILGVTSILCNNTLTTEQKEFVQLINQSSGKLLTLIDKVHTLSKIEAGKIQVKSQAFNLSATLASIINEQRKKQTTGLIELQLLHDVTIADSITGDQLLLNQILSLLIVLGTSTMQQGIIRLFVQQTNNTSNFVKLNFTLNFNSNSSIVVKHLQSFYEVDKYGIFSLTKQAPINLLVAEKLILMQGGNIFINTNNGAEIIVTLNYAQSNDNKTAEAIPENQLEISAETLADKTVLIAEDNQVNQKILLNFLEKQQMHVTLVNNGKEVIDALQNKNFDCLLLDIKMPEMDGFQTAAFVRNKLQLGMPIVAITASNVADEKEKCIAFGIDEFITRPFAFTDLSTTLIQLLSAGKNKKNNTPTTYIEQNNYNKFYSLQSIYAVGDDDYCSGVLDFFLKDSPAVFKSIQLNLSLENLDEIFKTIQKYRSTLSVLQMHTLLNCINSIEYKITHKKNITAINADITEAAEIFRIMKPMIEAEISSLRKTVA